MAGRPSTNRTAAPQAEDLLASIVDTVLEGIITIDEEGRIERLNKAAAQMFGYRSDEAIGHNVSVLMQGPDGDRHNGHLRRYLQTGSAKIIGTGRELVGRRKDGGTFPMELAVSEVRSGDRCYFTGIVRDISARKQSEEALEAAHRDLEAMVAKRTAELEGANAALKDSEATLRLMTDALPIMISYVDREGCYQFVNHQYETGFGLPKSKIIGRRAAELLTEEFYAKARPHMEAALAGETRTIEETFTDRDGRRKCYSATYMPYLHDSGEVLGYFALAEDITERRESEQALEAAEANYRRLYDEAPHAYISVNAKDGTLERFNKAFADLLGYEAEELKGMQVASVYADTPDGAPKGKEIHERMISGQSTRNAEVQWLHKSGRAIWVSVSVDPVRDASGKVAESRGVGVDITARKQAELALRENEARFKDFAESGSDTFWELDEELHYKFFSGDFLPDFALPETFSDKAPWELFTSEASPEEWTRHIADLKAHRPFRNFTYKVDGGQDEVRYHRVSGKPLFDEEGHFKGYRGTASDVTDLVRAEKELERRIVELEAANEANERQGRELVEIAEDLSIARDESEQASHAKSDFLAHMSHELRTPLNAVIGFSEIIKSETFGPVGSAQYRDYAGDIHESGLHLLDLINDILDLSKVESGMEELNEEDVDIADAVRAILILVRGRAEGGDVELVTDIADALPMIRADKRKLKQILLNLASNAIKFTERGGAITVRTWCEEDGGHVLQVVDTGVGMAPEDVPKALAQFGQVGGLDGRPHEGTGLGLPLAKALVEFHGGRFELESALGVGTTVTLRFPRERTCRATGTTG